MPIDFDERSSMYEFEAGMSRAWSESFAKLECSGHKAFFPALEFYSTWKHRITEMGWSPDDIRNLIPLIGNRACIRFSSDFLVFQNYSGVEEKIFKRPVIGGPSIWQTGRRSA